MRFKHESRYGCFSSNHKLPSTLNPIHYELFISLYLFIHSTKKSFENEHCAGNSTRHWILSNEQNEIIDHQRLRIYFFLNTFSDPCIKLPSHFSFKVTDFSTEFLSPSFSFFTLHSTLDDIITITLCQSQWSHVHSHDIQTLSRIRHFCLFLSL